MKTIMYVCSQNGVFSWDPAQQGLLLGCYYYGYMFSNVPGAWLARRYGFKQVFGISMLFSAIITMCTPVAALTSFEFFVCLRIILGLLQVKSDVYLIML